jgi:DNA-binding NtrC family response regulator
MLQRLRIIVLGLESPLRRSFAALLESSGYRVIQAHSAAETIDIVRFEPIDMVLVDFTVPEQLRTVVIAGARKRNVRVLLLKSGGTGARTSPQPHVILAAPESPVEFLRVVEESIGVRAHAGQPTIAN